MRKRVLLTLLAVAGTLAAQNPTFTGVVNAASGIPPGLPNYGIAQGSIFVVYGSNLGPAAAAGTYVTSASIPLPTTAGLAGTSITVTVGGNTVPAPMIYTSPGQVAAIMPSNASTGSGSMTLTYNGKSGTTPVVVVKSAFGISNVSYGQGSNVGALTFGLQQNEFVTATDAAAPGDIVILFGTGLGAVTGGDTGYPAAGNIGSAPQVFVGGIASPSVAYYGRSPCCAGLDQIVFTVPQNAPLGCNVSVLIQTSNGTVPIVSNGPVMAIAATDHTACSDATQFIPPSFLSKSTVTAADVEINQNSFVSTNGSTTTTMLQGKAKVSFIQFTQAQLTAAAPGLNTEPSFGSCSVGFASTNDSGGGPPGTVLDAGASATLTTAGKSITLPSQGGQFSLDLTGAVPSGLYAFSSPGGANLGPQNFTFTLPQQVTWTNMSAITGSAVDRTQGLKVTWSGGDANGYVDILVQAQNSTGTFQSYIDCAAKTSDGQFTIPPSALLAMPTGTTALASVQVSTYAFPFTLGTIPGFDVALDTSEFQTQTPVVFK
ncbi:MAG TPA: hypothetical protein VG273_20950 [Bryobacteraceae bacterium]|jgi:uncharacterized protein (TIGR03437 family)|nr:hypothetical protein [Bryobacteraceae bacterium]